jgi:hypothetical protein
MAPTVVPSPDPKADKPPRQRRRIPVSVRIFAAILLLLGTGSALQICVPIYRQQSAIRTITQLGGQVDSEPGGPKWMREAFGGERMVWFDKVTLVDLSTSTATDAVLSRLNALPELEELYVGNSQMTPNGIRQLTKLKKLEQLSIPDTEISNWAVGELWRALPHLSIGTRMGPDYGLRITPASSQGPRQILFLRRPSS